MRKLTKEQIIEKCVQTHGNQYKYDFPESFNADTKIQIECGVHGKFFQNIRSHYNGTPCPKCNGRKTVYTTADFIDKANQIHEHKYSYAHVEYENTETKVLIGCPDHGLYYQAAKDHLAGKGCSVCAGNQSLTSEEVNKRAHIVHNGRYDNYHIKGKTLRCDCAIHGTFIQNIHHHLQGSGCPKCADINRRKKYFNEPTTLYYVKLNENLYKIGITKNTIEQRFKTEPNVKNVEVIKEYKFSTGKIAYQIEQELLEATKQCSVQTNILNGGNSELRTEDVLHVISPLVETPFD